jgi:L-ascorbate metabolism protein UlaG (beta-lactamase superfamily)
MIITYYGLSCFKIQSGDITLVFDLPARNASRSDAGGPSKKSDITPPRFHADIAFQSHDHASHNGAKDLPAGKAGLSGEREKEIFLIDTPGEHEIKGVYVEGLKTYHDSVMGKKHGINTAYVVRLENIKLCFLGDYGEKGLRPELKEGIGKIDILFVPIGGDTVLEPEAAQNLANQLEPAIVIPMHYTSGKKKDLPDRQAGALKLFLAEFGQKDIKPLEKFSIKKKDIAEDAGKRGTQIVVLSAL